MNNIDKLINNKLLELSKSKFRSSFHLRKYMIKYIDEKGMDTIKRHTADFIEQKLSDDPTFIAQHACACCCRGCLEKWHHIPKGKKLSRNEKNYIYLILIKWIENEYNKNTNQ